ncbi:MAG TPA: hypothetical protein VE262_16065 [Blastocatellia bacterium]|nr:hypothetical protein [Blastocatellia bacterium]
MAFGITGRPARTKPQRKGKGAPPAPKIHSMAASLRAGRFAGTFAAGGPTYRFAYAPASAALVDQRLELRGRLTVTNARGRSFAREGVRAVLVGTQGGIGTAPERRQVMAGGVQTGTLATSGQQQAAADTREAARQDPRQAPAEGARTPALPEVDSTGPYSFCGVMYFQFEPLDGRALGVAADLTRVQLNARLAPGDDVGREHHAVYSSLVAALSGEGRDARAAAAYLEELNRSLK